MDNSERVMRTVMKFNRSNTVHNMQFKIYIHTQKSLTLTHNAPSCLHNLTSQLLKPPAASSFLWSPLKFDEKRNVSMRKKCIDFFLSKFRNLNVKKKVYDFKNHIQKKCHLVISIWHHNAANCLQQFRFRGALLNWKPLKFD